MKFTTGFFKNGVLQRGRGNCCEQAFEGTCSSSGVVYLDVSKNGRVLKDFRKIKAGIAAKGAFKGVVSGVPVGGPYSFSFSIDGGDSCIVENIMVGDLWILAGQSNMEGCGRINRSASSLDQVRAYYMDNRWNIAEDPIHTLWKAAAPVHCGNPAAKNPHPYIGTGPGVSFGQEMFRKTGVPQGLLSCAHGGTTMAQWDPSLKKLGDKSFYGATCNRLKRLGGKVAGVIWYQGCSDAVKDTAPSYTRNMVKLVSAFRKDVGNPALPFVIVQIGRVCNSTQDPASWNSVRIQQGKLPEKIRNLLMVPSIDFSLDDTIHLSGESQLQLGQRLADAMLCFYDKKRLKPIEPGCKVTLSSDPYRADITIIKIPFKNVSGSLVAGSRPSGFSVIDRSRVAMPDVFKVTLDGSNAIVRVAQMSNSISSICYGYGLDPYCNITDEAGRGIPAFEVFLNRKPLKPAMPFVSEFLVSDPVYTAEILENMDPSVYARLDFRNAYYGGFFVSHPEREKFSTPEDKIFFLKCRLECSEDMKLRFLFGYDGPVRVFLDSKQIYKDMKGTNPIIKDHHSFCAVLDKGCHEVVIALASNNGKMWGCCLRAERMDKGTVFPMVVPADNLK